MRLKTRAYGIALARTHVSGLWVHEYSASGNASVIIATQVQFVVRDQPVKSIYVPSATLAGSRVARR